MEVKPSWRNLPVRKVVSFPGGCNQGAAPQWAMAIPARPGPMLLGGEVA